MYLTFRKTLAIGGTAAAIIGLGGTAMAVSGDHTVAGSTAKPDKAKGHSLLRGLEHGQFVTHTKKKGAVTHTIWRGTVTAVSATSLTVRAADAKSQTYAITKDTAVKQRVKGQKKPADSSISKVAKGDKVLATGTGTSTVTAKRVVELPK